MADYGWSFPELTPDKYFQGVNVASLPAGMRNNNIGNIKWSGWSSKLPGAVGPSKNLDQGDPQVTFSSPESGVAAAAQLALNKYQAGKTDLNSFIAGPGGWTPGYQAGANNIAKTMGIKPTDDLNLNDPASMTKFIRALAMQEHGPDSKRFQDDTINAGVNAVFGKAQPQVAQFPSETQGLLGPVSMPANAQQPAPSQVAGLFGAGGATMPQNVQMATAPSLFSQPSQPSQQLAAAWSGKSDDKTPSTAWGDKQFANLASTGLGLMAAGSPRQTWTPSAPAAAHRPELQNLFAGLLGNPYV